MKLLKQLPKEDIASNAQLYDEYINNYGMDNGWLPGNQMYNFKSLLKLPLMTGIPLKGKSILDVGCGTGDFLKLLEENEIAQYGGIDIYEPSIQIARKNYPDKTFILGDPLQTEFESKFHYAFCSGALTVNLSIDNYEFLHAMVEKMWQLSTVGIAFNVLTDDDPEQDQNLFFYNPEKVLQLCMDIAPEAIIGAEKTPHVSQIHVYMYRND